MTCHASLRPRRANCDARYLHNWARGDSNCKGQRQIHGRFALLASSSTFAAGIALLSQENEEKPGSLLAAHDAPKYAERKTMLKVGYSDIKS
jgi:hypothetical protein